MFRFEGSTWVQEEKLQAKSGEDEDAFGSAVSLDANRALVGAPQSDDNGNRSGSAFVFRFDGTTWHEEQKLIADDASILDQFGFAVDLNGETAIIGAPFDNDGDRLDKGTADVFGHDEGSWTDRATLAAGDSAEGDSLGIAVLVGEDGSAWVGALGVDTTEVDTGACYLFRGAASNLYGQGWTGSHGVPHLGLVGEPILDTPLTLTLENSSGEWNLAFLLAGLQKAETKTSFGGTLLVAPILSIPLVLDPSGASVDAVIGPDCELNGVSVYVQCLQVDPGASRGVSFTRGLELDFGSF